MSTISDKKTQALEACEKVINGIEDGTISISSALLLCKKIARLVNDQDGMEWLDFELGGYKIAKGLLCTMLGILPQIINEHIKQGTKTVILFP